MTTRTGAAPPWSADDAALAAFLSAPGDPHHLPLELGEGGQWADPGPFAADVKAGKNSPIYNAHAYHTKVPPEGIVPYLLHYTRPGDLVLDPFCGSGMTGVAALMTGRRCLLNDLSPAATHIAAGYTQPVDLPAVQSAWRRVAAQLAPLCAELYATTCHRCHGPATMLQILWSDTYSCRACGQEIVLWDAAAVRAWDGEQYDPPLSAWSHPQASWAPPGPTDTGKPQGAVIDHFACPYCLHSWSKTDLERKRTIPAIIDTDCQGNCRPRRRSRSLDARDVSSAKSLQAAPILEWMPKELFSPHREMWRGVHSDLGIETAADFWTARNLRVLATAWKLINAEDDRAGVRLALRFAFTSTLIGVSRMRRYRPAGIGGSYLTGTLYIPSLTLEVHVGKLLAKKVDDYIKARTVLAAARPSPPGPLSSVLEKGRDDRQVLVRTGSATYLEGVPDGVIDYVFTDPPFGANIFYADCSFPWEAWLGCFTDEAHEAVWNKSRKPEQGGKTLDDYAHLMELSFREIARVLKPGRWASVVFHNSDDRVWDAIRDAAASAGLSLANAVALDKVQRSFKGIKGEKGEERVTNFDIVLNLQKPASGRAPTSQPQAPPGDGRSRSARWVAMERGPGGEGTSPSEPPGAADDAETDERIAAILAEHLAALSNPRPQSPSLHGMERGPGGEATAVGEQRTTQFLHSLVIRRLLSEGLPVTDVDYARVERVARAYFKLVDGRWYGLGEEVAPAQMQSALPGLGAHAPRLADEASAIAWVRELIRANGPQPWGDLINALQRAAAGLRVRPEELLSQNFVLDARRNRWRLPTAAELEELGDVQRRLLIQRVDRWLGGAGRAPNGEEKAAWFDRLFAYGEHRRAWAVFQRTHADELDPATWDVLRRRARVSMLRAGGAQTTTGSPQSPPLQNTGEGAGGEAR